MKPIKMFRLTAAILVLSISGGCSDEINSPKMSEPIAGSISELSQEDLSVKVFRSEISLKPGETYSFDYSNSGFYSFNFIMVTVCDVVEIKGYNDDELIVLSCYSSGFTANSITVKNLSSEVIEPVIYLKGSDKKSIHPDPKIVESQG